jgi:type I restriction enzyme R subunit
VPVKTEAGKVTETVQLIDWAHPERNDFAIAEEVTLKGGLGGHERRPDSCCTSTASPSACWS